MKRKPPAYYFARLQKLARKFGGTVLSRVYRGDNTKLRFRCAAGHEWMLTPGGVKQGHWCRKCRMAEVGARKTVPARARLYQRVALRGGTVLSPTYVNSQTRMRFRCAEGHEWETMPNVIAVGGWCRVCVSRERGLRDPRRELVRARMQRAVSRHGGEMVAPALTGAKTRFGVRCENGHVWLARIDGIDRGAWCPLCKAETIMSRLDAEAARWGGECLTRDCQSTRARVLWRCAQGHRFEKEAAVVLGGGWCAQCRGVARSDLDRMRQMARERGGLCLSKRYVSIQSKLLWRCREGHEWLTDPTTIVRGHWCPECAKWGTYSRQRLSIEVMREMAEERGGVCLSKFYNSNRDRLRWRCAKGHVWVAHVNRVRQGAWCKVCSHSSRGTIEGMRVLASERGGRCLSNAWNNHRAPLRFECRRGHRFEALGNVVKSGLWCPACKKKPGGVEV